MWLKPGVMRQFEVLLALGDYVQELHECVDSLNGIHEGRCPPHMAFVMGRVVGLPVVVLGVFYV